MTIDSTYLGYQSHNVDFLDSVYMFPWETVTSSAILVKVTYVSANDGLTYLVDIGPGNYSITLGGEEPIYYRGEIHFANPRATFVNEDIQLLFGRKTPITQELDLIPYTPAPMESVEFSIDKLTMILQEIEGDKCDCSGGPGGTTPPACVPVSLDSPLSPATIELSAYGQEVSWSAFAIGTAPFTYQWSLDGVDIVGATDAVFTDVIDDESQVGTYTVRVSNPCGVTTGSAQVLPAGCYACDAFSTFTSSLPGVHVFTPQSVVSDVDGYFFGNNEVLYPVTGGSPLLYTQSSYPDSFLQQRTPTDGMLDSCGQVLSGRIDGGSIKTLDSGKNIAQGGKWASGVLMDTATIGVESLSTDLYLRAAWGIDEDVLLDWPKAIGGLSVNLSLTFSSATGEPFGGGTTIDAALTATCLFDYSSDNSGTPPANPPDFAVYPGETDIYRFYRRASDQQFCNPVYVSAVISVSASLQINVKVYAGFGYRESTGAISPEGLVAEFDAAVPNPGDYFIDLNNVETAWPLYPVVKDNVITCDFQDLWIGPSITTPQWTETLHQAKRNMLVYGCDPVSTCVPVVLGAMVNSLGDGSFEIDSYPAAFNLSAPVTSATTDEILWQWFKNGTAVTGQGPLNDNLIVDVDSEADLGNYSVTAVNACGSDTSSQQITYAPPACIPLGSGILIPAGTNYAYGEWPGQVFMNTGDGGTGSFPRTVEWYKDGIQIEGQTGTAYTAPMAAQEDLGEYYTIIRNDCSSTQSNVETYTMDACVPVAVDPLDPPSYDFTFFGETITWTAVATGSNPITYQWRKDGVDIPGETGATFTKTFASEADTGLYSVLVTNDCGTANRGAAVNYTDPGVCEPPVVPQIEPADNFHDGVNPLPLTWVASPTGTDSPMTYQWYFKQLFSSTYNEIVGETSDTLSVVVNGINEYGYYLIIATNACGTDSSEAFVTGDV